MLLLPLASRAQAPLNDLVFTVGTTIQDTNGQPWSYVLLSSPQPALLSGKRFALYSKTGYPTNAGSYALRGTIFQQTGLPAINSLLNQSLALGEDLTALSNVLNVLLINVPGVTNETLAQKIVSSFQAAAADAGTAQTLTLLGHLHPGLMLCAGQAFSEQINTTTSYEIRELDPNTGVAGSVVGRVTVIPGSPIILPAPGMPFQVVTNDGTDHLRVRLRWGTPDALRRLSLLSFGFNVWRIARGPAESAGYNVTPPSLGQLYSDVNFTRANHNPAFTTKDYSAGSGTGAADDPADPVTVFFTDDNGASQGHALFNDGDQFYYFITTRDVLGRDGLVSPGRLCQACRRLAPQAPTSLRVANSTTQTNLPRLLVTWQQNTNPADAVTEYWVYRFPNPAMAMTNDATPFSNRVAVVAQAPATNLNAYLDLAPDAPTAAGPTNFWYTVRAVSQAACAALLSPHSAPAWGVVRQRQAPDAATGKVLGSCGTPVVMFQTSNLLTNQDGPDLVNWNYRFTCNRRDPGIAWVQFSLSNVETLPPIYFDPENDTVQTDYALPILGPNYTNDIWCTVGTYYGSVSAPAVAHFTTALSSNQQLEAVFLAGQLLETALNGSDPLLATLNGLGPPAYPAFSVTPDPSGTVHMLFSAPPNTPLLIQVLQSNTWVNLGTYISDSNNVCWVSYPACLVGPVPPFQGSRVNLPGGIGDCAQHVARAADNGPVAPIRVQFGLTPRTHEYRLYRTVDGGPLTLMAQDAQAYDTNNVNKQIVHTDDTMPPSASRLCYFLQVLDENGNGSPMTFLGCKEVKPAKLPRPVLAEPRNAGSNANPQVTLNWFCPTSGVYRFQIKIARADQPGSGQPTGLFNPRLSLQANFNPVTRYAGLLKQTKFQRLARLSRLAFARFDEAQLTAPVGVNFGSGPQFTVTANVVPGVPYNISIAAMDAQGNVGDSSLVWQFTWTPPIVLANVPWPARPLPPVTSFNEDYPGGPYASLIYSPYQTLDTRNPVGIVIGGFSEITQNYQYNQILLNAGSPTNGFLIYSVSFFNVVYTGPPAAPAPDTLVMRRRSGDASRRGQSLLPIVVYRQQLANTNFPHVSGNLIQVTPLIEKIAYSVTNSLNSSAVTVLDRMIVGGLVPLLCTNCDQTFINALLLRDQQPVIRGARYNYFVMRLNDKREIDEVIPAGFVDIPTSP